MLYYAKNLANLLGRCQIIFLKFVMKYRLTRISQEKFLYA